MPAWLAIAGIALSAMQALLPTIEGLIKEMEAAASGPSANAMSMSNTNAKLQSALQAHSYLSAALQNLTSQPA